MGLFEAPYPYSNWKDYDRTAEAAAVECVFGVSTLQVGFLF